MQEIFTGPYFCAEQSTRWYDATERIPDGPTTQPHAAAREEARDGDHRPALRGGWRRASTTTPPPSSTPTARTSANTERTTSRIARRASGRSSTSGPATSGIRSSRRSYADVGVYICYDRHFPEGARELGLNGAEIVFNPSATVAGLSEYLWKLEQPAHAVANAFFVGAINRVGYEDAVAHRRVLRTELFLRSARSVRGAGVARQDELITAELDLDKIREVRNVWQFFRDRRPETYGGLVKP